MTSSFRNIKLFSSLLLRGYALGSKSTANEAMTSRNRGKMTAKTEEERAVSNEKGWWKPDPVTGFYKPENINKIDAAELRVN
ncbi:unnamed protein product [Sphenostylis stenocarpa]|uniref:Uncharacterized protein n=1 Tax=Sphenostylis stenocarpa TaxID=92480 RepID=A0AA86SRH8_9FABA|nr:unnamed protein product [Sphenostylis stenocarpa]